ncbi:MAG: globin domain-containing protein [Methyloceanibacter sp.]
MPAALQASIAPKPTSRRGRGPVSDHLTAKQKRLIAQSFLHVEPALDLVAQLFFLKLFRLDPSLRKKFEGPVEMQARKFAAGMKLTMISLGHEDGLAPTLKLLGARHRQLGIRSRHYRTMSKALIWTLGRSLEDSFDRDTKDAWTALLDHLTGIMEG